MSCCPSSTTTRPSQRANPVTKRTIFLILRAKTLPFFRLSVPHSHDRYGLTETSRLGCQVKLTPDMNGMQVASPNSIHQAALRTLCALIVHVCHDFPSHHSPVQAARGHPQLLRRRPQAQAALERGAAGEGTHFALVEFLPVLFGRGARWRPLRLMRFNYLPRILRVGSCHREHGGGH
jgi:hypothetical protein